MRMECEWSNDPVSRLGSQVRLSLRTKDEERKKKNRKLQKYEGWKVNVSVMR